VSIAENLDLQLYRESAEAIMCALLPDSPTATSSRTDGNVPFFLSHTHRCTYVYIQKGHHGYSVKLLIFFFFFFFFFMCLCLAAVSGTCDCHTDVHMRISKKASMDIL